MRKLGRSRIGAFALIVALGLAPLAARGQAQDATIQGQLGEDVVKKAQGGLINLVDPATGQLVASQAVAASFSFTGIAPGTYVVQVVNAANQIVAASGNLAAVAGTVTTLATLSGAGGAGAAGLSTRTLALASAAVALGIVTIIAVTRSEAAPASPSR